jgi:hypothetical protein
MIEKNGYLVRYHDSSGKEVDFDNQNAVHFTLKQWGAIHCGDPGYQKKTGDILISACDTFINKRVILDS